MCRSVRVAEGFRTENAVSEPRHRQMCQFVCVAERFPDRNRGCQVGLVKDGKRYWKRVHQLVAEAFLPNPDHLPQIDHKDGNYLNNYADNLRWVSPADNARSPNTIGHLRGNREEQRKQREARKMIQRLERMRTNDRCIITDQYMICFDRINNYYFLTGTETSNSPVPFRIGDHLNDDGTIDYVGLWEDIKKKSISIVEQSVV